MNLKRRQSNKSMKRYLFTFSTTLIALACFSLQGAEAQQPPPVGDGPSPAPVTPGDAGAAPPATSGFADPSPGHNFPTTGSVRRQTIRVFHDGPRGERQVTTIRPDSLPQNTRAQVLGLLGVAGNTNQIVDATVDDARMEQLNEILAPYPNSVDFNGRKFIWQDDPAANRPRTNARYRLTPAHPVPTVWAFGRYLVILGVTAATVFMALAAWSMVLGSPYGASRVVGAAAGLMLLLSAYTIWKIVQMNTFNANSDTPATINRGADVPSAFTYRPTQPGIPGGNSAIGRQGFPVQPLRNAQN